MTLRQLVFLLLFVLLGAYALYLFALGPAEPIKVSITIPSGSFTFLWAYIGEEKGFFEEEGIDVEIIVTRPATTAVQAVISGSAEFTAAAESAATAMLQGADLRIVGYWMVDKHLCLMGGPGVERVEDLLGKTVGVSRLRSQTAVITEEILMSFGLEPGTNVELVGVGGSRERLVALQQGSIDAALDSGPDCKILEDLGFNLLVMSGDVLDRRPIAFLATSSQMVEDHADTVKKVVKAMIRSLRFVKENEEETVEAAVELLEIEEELARAAYEIFKEDWGYRIDPADLEALFEVQNMFLEEPVQYDTAMWIDYSIVNEVLEELGEQPLP